MIRCLREFDLAEPLRQLRSVPVSLGKGAGEAALFVHADTPNLDPWEEALAFPEDTLKLTLMTAQGQRLWRRDLGPGTIPGIWFAPVLSFDLDGDGVEEIWCLGNTRPDRPFTLEHRVLERMDPRTGEVTGQWKWPDGLRHETMSHTYRYTLAAGFSRGEPVLVTAQGTYGDMYLQAYGPGMKKRWEVMIPRDAPGARASHVFPVLDFDGDGVDELFWGERVLSMDDGHELFCCDREGFRAHSDIVVPFVDPDTDKRYIYTCREGQEQEGVARVACYDAQGRTVWASFEGGHMHKGWVANIGEGGRRVAMAMSLALGATGGDIHRSKPLVYYFDAVTGARVDFDFPYPGYQVMPVDFDGQGIHGFVGTEGEAKGKAFDRRGTLLADLGRGEQVSAGKILDRPGQQVMLFYPEEGKVRVFGQEDARPGPGDRFAGYHRFMQRLMASGYNHINGVVSCGM